MESQALKERKAYTLLSLENFAESAVWAREGSKSAQLCPGVHGELRDGYLSRALHSGGSSLDSMTCIWSERGESGLSGRTHRCFGSSMVCFREISMEAFKTLSIMLILGNTDTGRQVEMPGGRSIPVVRGETHASQDKARYQFKDDGNGECGRKRAEMSAPRGGEIPHILMQTADAMDSACIRGARESEIADRPFPTIIARGREQKIQPGAPSRNYIAEGI
ncbi:hypothetical protein B0H13DRAFT_1921523 [Mycena leptocephala]|nr:hypothetical protein B0H13DRAFT_1921523 [Mycena leptocephala]